MLELTRHERGRIFNLGFFTWVEECGEPVEAFEARREASYWTGLRRAVIEWDAAIEAFNARTGVTVA